MDTQAPERPAAAPSPWRSVYPNDTVGKALVYSLQQPMEPTRRNAFMRAIGQQGPEIGFGIACLCLVLVAFAVLLIGAFTGDSGTGSFSWGLAIDAVLFQALIIFWSWYAPRAARGFPDGVKSPGEVSVRSLRRAALTGNDELASAVDVVAGDDVQAALLTGSGSETLIVTPPEWRLLRGAKILSGVFIPILVALGGLSWLTGSGSSGFPWSVVVFYPLAIILILWAFVYCLRRLRAFRVTVGADGLHWRKKTLPWSEVCGWYVFYLFPMNTSWTHPNAVYALVGQHASLTWLAYPEPVESDDPGKRLAQLVQAHLQWLGHESLPLRDLTPGAISISYEVGPRPYWWGRWRLLAADAHDLMGSSLPHLPAAVSTFLLAVLVLLGNIFVPNLQQWYFGGQLARMEASISAIRDPLTTNTLHWMTAPVYGDHKTFTFTPQGYVYPSGDCCGASSYIPRSVGDGLVEVTVTIHPKDQYDYDQDGIIVRANSQTKTALVFSVRPTGSWELDRFTMGADRLHSDMTYLRSGSFGDDKAIHPGQDVIYRLAVLMQGWSYTLFVDGQFVGRYWGSDLPQSGQVGIYAEGLDGPVTFSDLLIAPA